MKTEYQIEREIWQEALKHLKQALPIRQARINWEVHVNKRVIDAIVRFDGLLVPQYLMIKGNLRPETIAGVMILKDHIPKPFLLVTKHVTLPIAKRLKTMGIQFLDTAGNMFIEQDDPRVFIYIVGNKYQGKAITNRARLFRNAELRVLFILLCQKDAIRKPYREIAQMAGVALGTVGNTINDLREHGHISNMRIGRCLNRRMNLVDKWADAFVEELRPRLNPRCFTTEERGWWKNTDIKAMDICIGGELAAEELTGYLHPEVATVYIGTGFNMFAHALKLRKDENGSIFVLDKFWNTLPEVEGNTPNGIAPPLLVYADLLRDGGARNVEVAGMIREQYIDK